MTLHASVIEVADKRLEVLAVTGLSISSVCQEGIIFQLVNSIHPYTSVDNYNKESDPRRRAFKLVGSKWNFLFCDLLSSSSTARGHLSESGAPSKMKSSW